MGQTQTFPGRYDQVRRLCQFVVNGAAEAGLDPKACFHVELACDEAATNIIEHAYGGEDRGVITAAWEITADAFVVALHDTGRPFDPDQIRPVAAIQPNTAVDEVSIGGLGLHFMRELMDELYFHFDPAQGNQVTLVKWLPTAPQPLDVRTLHNGIHIIAVRGRLDQFLAQQLEAQTAPLLTSEPPRLIIDLSQTTYIDSGGLRVLVAAWRRARRAKGDVVLHGLNERIAEILALVGFNQLFTIYDGRQQALAHFSG